jgi:hypothetical protein
MIAQVQEEEDEAVTHNASVWIPDTIIPLAGVTAPAGR